VPAGQTTAVPAGVAHTWWNAGHELMLLSGRVVPASDLDRFIQALWAASNASPSGRPSIFHIAHIVWRHRRTQAVVLPPKAIHRIVFPSILLLGTVLGKYRGTTWPGSPASCTGAPETVTRAPLPADEHSEGFVKAS